MNLEKYLAVTGLPGLYTMISSKPNGLMVKDLEDGKTKFCSVRKYQFTPLETVGIYTMTDTEDLKTIFTSMLEKRDLLPDAKSSKDVLLDYFAQILPNFDRDRVYPNHIKKIISWFSELEAKGIFKEEEKPKEEKVKAAPKAKAPSKAKAKAAPKAKAASKAKAAPKAKAKVATKAKAKPKAKKKTEDKK